MGRKLYVGNLPYSASQQTLQETFGRCGTVESANVITDRDTGQSKGFGFVEMGSDEEAQAAIAALNGYEHNGRTLNVDEARDRPRRPGGRSGHGHGGYGGGVRDRRGGRTRW